MKRLGAVVPIDDAVFDPWGQRKLKKNPNGTPHGVPGSHHFSGGFQRHDGSLLRHRQRSEDLTVKNLMQSPNRSHLLRFGLRSSVVPDFPVVTQHVHPRTHLSVPVLSITLPRCIGSELEFRGCKPLRSLAPEIGASRLRLRRKPTYYGLCS